MCVVSMIGDHYKDKWTSPPYDWLQPYIVPRKEPTDWNELLKPFKVEPTQSPISRKEFDDLKKEVLEMKELLQKAVEYDKKTNQPHCETEEKIALLKQVAKLFGVELESILK